MSEDYVEVEVVLLAVREKSIRVRPAADDSADPVWVARSCIHGIDERDLDNLSTNQTITLRIFRWLAEKEGLL